MNGISNGIEVRGNSTASQYIIGGVQAQGSVLISNGGTIKDALIGINTIKVNTDGSYDYNYTGGIVRSNNGFFENNKKSIIIHSYHNPLVSIGSTLNYEPNYNGYIVNSMFRVSQSTFPLDNFIFFYDIKRFKIQGNTFNEGVVTSSNKAIIAFDASFEVSKWFPITGTPRQNRFRYSDIGIATYNTTPKYLPVNIDRNIFEANVSIGTYAYGNNNLTFIRNSIETSYVPAGYPTVPTGLYLNQVPQFKVTENDFDGISTSSSQNSNGVVVKSAGHAKNWIYNNSFYRYKYATKSHGDNVDENDVTNGVQIRCNDFSQNLQDIFVDGNPFYEGIAMQQGAPGSPGNQSPTLPAGNIFSANSSGLSAASDYDDYANNIAYYHHTEINTIPYRRSTSTVSASNTGISYINKATACPTNIVDPPNLGTIVGTIGSNSFHMRRSQDLVDSLTDAGNSTAMLYRIDTTTTPGYPALRTYLLSKSPYLSLDVLLKAGLKLPDTSIVSIYKANPHGARDLRLIDTLKHRTIPMHDSLITKIRTVVGTISARDTMHANLAHFSAVHENLIFDLINTHLADTTYNGRDSAIAILRNETSLRSAYQLVGMYIENNDSTKAMNVLDSIPVWHNLKGSDVTVYSDFRYITKLGDSLRVFKHLYRWHDIDSASIVKLQGISSSNQYFPGAYACNILMFIGVDTCDIYFNNPAPRLSQENNTDEQAPDRLPLASKNKHFIMYPNPATDQVSISYQMAGIENKAIFEVYSTTGQLIIRQSLNTDEGIFNISTSQLAKGIYYVMLKNNSGIVDAQKLIVN